MFSLFRRRPAAPVEKPLSELNKDELLTKLRTNLAEPVLTEVLTRARHEDNKFIDAIYLRELLSAYKSSDTSGDNKVIISNIFLASESYIITQSTKHAEVRELQAIIIELRSAAADATTGDPSAITARP